MYGNGCTVWEGKGETCMHFCHYDFCNQDHIFYNSEFINSHPKLLLFIPFLLYCLILTNKIKINKRLTFSVCRGVKTVWASSGPLHDCTITFNGLNRK